MIQCMFSAAVASCVTLHHTTLANCSNFYAPIIVACAVQRKSSFLTLSCLDAVIV